MTNDIKKMRINLECIFYLLLIDLEVDEKYVKEFGEAAVRSVCMRNAVERIEKFCEEEELDIDRVRKLVERASTQSVKSNEQTDDFKDNPLTVV